VAQATAAARQAVTRDEDALTATTRAPAPPAARYAFYVVRRGETLTALARRFQTSPDVLRQLNQLSADEIQVGQRLRVPTVDVDSLP
jgi:LysM repeat protein